MRILITNPDTLGDVVLRQPLFRAMADAGHEIAMVVQPLVQPLARTIAPGARIIELPIGVYNGRIEPEDERLDPVIEAVPAFEPAVIVGAPYTWTVLEDRLAAAFPDVRKIGQAGGRFIDPWNGRLTEPTVPFDEIVRVNADLHEVRKSEALARTILADDLHLPDPVLELGPEHRDSAEAVLAGLGLERDGYTAACVGHSSSTAIRNWRPDHWVESLAHLMEEHDRPLLLLGGRDEEDVTRTIGDGLEARGLEPRYWFGEIEGDTLLLAGLLQASRGFIGRDTGPMHVAAALGRPVLAVFGGGTWPRFRPLVAPSVSVTLAVPCSPCDWRCEQHRSYCIMDVPLGEIVAQIDRMEAGEVSGSEVRQLEPSRATLVGIASQAATAARQYRVEVSIAKRELADAKEEHKDEVRRKSMSETALMQRLDRLEQAIQRSGQTNHQAEEAKRRASEVTQKLTQNTQALQQAQRELAQAVQKVENTDERNAKLVEEVSKLRELLTEANAKAQSFKAERDQAQERLAQAKERGTQLQAERDAAEGDAAELRAKYAHVDLPALQRDLKAARQLAAVVQGEKSDLTLRAERLLQERKAMEKLANQRLETIKGLEYKLGRLLASRWRQVGQRMRMAVVLPWEEDERNRLLGTSRNGHGTHQTSQPANKG
ncbi:MAG: glycosyltransferase family 9 protein [Phycisphaerales bacterium]